MSAASPTSPPTPEPPSPRSAMGVLQTPIWPRTLRRMLGSILLPWIWGRMGRRPIEAFIASTNLPAPIALVVSNIVRRTRLWPSERMDVAHELAAHFADGLHAGRPEAHLIRDFGDPAAAATLIRRAKVRGRPLWWHSWKWIVRTTGVLTLGLILTYAWLAARFYYGSPTIRRNYAGEMNAAILATPLDQRAWPMYVRAIREMGELPTLQYRDSDWPGKPTDPDWPSATAWLDEHATALTTLHAAARSKRIGYILSNTMDADYMHALEVRTPKYKYDPSLETAEDNPLLFGVLLPYLGEMRSQARLLRFEARVNIERGQPARFIESLDAILGMVDQCAANGTFIDSLVAIAIGDLAANLSFEALGRDDFLRDDDLVHIGHRFGAIAGGRISFNPAYERMMFEDMLQRFYTDDGNGDGHLVASEIDRLHRTFGINRPAALLAKSFQPVRLAAVPSRAKVKALLDAYIATIARNDALQPWRHDELAGGSTQSELFAALDPVFPASALAGGADNGGFAQQFAARDAFETRRAAVMTMCALVRHHRLHGSFPATLDPLVPALLPTLPLDPFDGNPLRYRLTGEGPAAQPLLYSIGVDLTDDHGAPPADEKDRTLAREASKLAYFRPGFHPTPVQQREMDRCRGDWILFSPK